MRKGFIVAVATLAIGLTGLFASPAKGLQYGFNLGYSSVGFQLNGISGEFVLGFQEKDEHRPQGSLLRIGLGGAWGKSATDLTKATWNGQSVEAFKPTVGAAALDAARAQEINDPEMSFAAQTLQRQALIDKDIATNLLGGEAALEKIGLIQRPAARERAIETLKNTALERALSEGYSIDDITKAEGNATAIFLTLAYEYVLAQGAPGLGFVAGAEIYISRGGYKGNTTIFPDVKTEGGIGGGGIVGVSYYMKNGVNFTVKTGFGAVNPGKVDYSFLGNDVTVEPATTFYVSPTLSVGYIY